jgi:hypothetical protein
MLWDRILTLFQRSSQGSERHCGLRTFTCFWLNLITIYSSLRTAWIMGPVVLEFRSQWPRGLKHELWNFRTLGSWVRTPIKTWIFVYVYSMFVLSCVGSGLATGLSPIRGVLPTVLGLRSETKLFTDTLCSSVRGTGKKERWKRSF